MLLIDKLSDYELDTIRDELNPLFEKNFHPSSVSDKGKVNLDIRNSESFFPNLDIVRHTSLILQLRAKEYFSKYINFDGMIPDVQLLKYGPGQFYNWHSDIINNDYDPRFIRVITISLNLNDQYTGGGLEVKHKGEVIELSSEPGSIIIFPSFLVHRALTVESGERRAVTLWIKGDVNRLNKLNHLYKNQTVE